MSSARAYANQKLYYASIHLLLLRDALSEENHNALVLRESLGQSVAVHLRDAYGWFLLELAATDPLPQSPPGSTGELLQRYPCPEPLRGELVELRNLENAPESWLAGLLGADVQGVTVPRASSPLNLAAADPGWDPATIAQWYDELLAVVERMSDSLEEW